MKKRIKIRDKFVFEDHPKCDIDFIEVSLPDNEVDNFVNKYAPDYFRRQSQDFDQLMKRDAEKQDMRDALYKEIMIQIRGGLRGFEQAVVSPEIDERVKKALNKFVVGCHDNESE